MVLAELGARVIKVEQPGSGDETRTFEPQLARDSAYYFACNRSKESITVDLRSQEGAATIRALAQKADVLVENFPVGTLGRYGLDFAALSSLNPALIFVSCTGFGQTGPYAKKKGYDTVFQAMGGLMSLTGEKGGGPVKPGLPGMGADAASGSPKSIWRFGRAAGAAGGATAVSPEKSMLRPPNGFFGASSCCLLIDASLACPDTPGGYQGSCAIESRQSPGSCLSPRQRS